MRIKVTVLEDGDGFCAALGNYLKNNNLPAAVFIDASNGEKGTGEIIRVINLIKNEAIFNPSIVIRGTSDQNVRVFSRCIYPNNDFFTNETVPSRAVARKMRQIKERWEQNILLLASAMSSIWALVLLLNMRDEQTCSHSLCVVGTTEKMTEAMNLPIAERNVIKGISLLHDVGKMGTHDDVLLKQGKLSDEEWGEMREHPENAMYGIVPIAAYWGKYGSDLLDAVKYHHTRLDGTGYPNEEEGTIPTRARRIITVADAFDAMTTYRHYESRRRNLDEIKKEIERCIGTQFEREPAETLLSILDNEGINLAVHMPVAPTEIKDYDPNAWINNLLACAGFALP